MTAAQRRARAPTRWDVYLDRLATPGAVRMDAEAPPVVLAVS